MAQKKKSRDTTSPRAEAFTREQYKGHEVLIPRDERRRRIFIDGRPVGFGIAGGTFYLSAHAYEPGQTLLDVVKRYLDDRDRRAARRQKGA